MHDTDAEYDVNTPCSYYRILLYLNILCMLVNGWCNSEKPFDKISIVILCCVIMSVSNNMIQSNVLS